MARIIRCVAFMFVTALSIELLRPLLALPFRVVPNSRRASLFILLHPPSPFSRCFNADEEGVSAK